MTEKGIKALFSSLVLLYALIGFLSVVSDLFLSP